jgi:hypothetical protein
LLIAKTLFALILFFFVFSSDAMFALARFDLKNPEKKISLRLEASFPPLPIAQMMMISRLAVLEQAK